MFFYTVDIAIYNAYVLYSKLPNSTKQSMINFRLNIAQDILYKLSLPNYSTRGRPSQNEYPIRLQTKHWAHFPQHIPSTNKKKLPTKRCRVGIKYNIRSETTWQCKKCLVPLLFQNVSKYFILYRTIKLFFF